MAGITGIVHSSQPGSQSPFDLFGSELNVIAAVVLGCTRIHRAVTELSSHHRRRFLVTIIQIVCSLVLAMDLIVRGTAALSAPSSSLARAYHWLLRRRASPRSLRQTIVVPHPRLTPSMAITE